MKKYLSVFLISLRDQLIYLRSFMARNIFFVVILFIFFSLWRVVYATREALAGFTMVQALWYLTVTETVELSKSRIFLPISYEVKDGTIAYTLGRPYSYVAFWISRAMGENVVKIAPMLATGAATAMLLVGPLPGYLRALPFGLVAMVLGMLLGTLWQVWIGLLAFWFEEVSPFYWILQKMIFIVGGLFIPIDFYPDWLQRFAVYSPFAFSAYWPATTMVAFTPERFLTTVVGQLAYAALLTLAIAATFVAAARRVHVQGG
jgi:ABC-2 type transport system permease protein